MAKKKERKKNMYTKRKVTLDEIEFRTKDYDISGNMKNGGSRDENGVWKPFVHKARYTRQIVAVNYEEGLLKCIGGRHFVIDNDLEVIECNY